MNYIEKLKDIDKKNIYLIGDVHGCYFTLLTLLKKLPKNAFIIFVGDLCDKGNFSKEVYQLVIDSGFLCILGNHDYMFLKYIKKILKTKKNNIWSSNIGFGGYKTINSYKSNNLIGLDNHLNFVSNLPNFIQIDNLFITHGFGLPYYKRKTNKDFIRSLMSNRIDDTKYSEDWEDFSEYNIINIFGHCDFDKMRIGNNFIGIDTSCVYGGKLTALKLDSIMFNEDFQIDKGKLIYFDEKLNKKDTE